jgi:hypothetical protein
VNHSLLRPAAAAGYTQLCFIGAGNSELDPYRYQMEWWQP